MHTLPTPFTYQHEDANWLATRTRGALLHQPGCISGSAVIPINLVGCAKKITLRELFLYFHGESHVKKHRGFRKKRGNIKVRSLDEANNKIVLNDIKDVIFSGFKQVYGIHLSKDIKLRCTEDHLIYTDKGWVRADKLIRGVHKVAINANVRPKSRKLKKTKTKYYCINLPAHYPYGSIRTQDSGVKYIRREYHILVCEAHKNGFSDVTAYIQFIRDGNTPTQIIDSKKYAVHHIDDNVKNNALDNLQVLSHNEHAKLHSKTKKEHFNQHVVAFRSIHWIKKLDVVEDVYDIACYEPHHSFVADNIIVHNCGKTLISVLAIYIKSQSEKKKQHVLVLGPKTLKYVWDEHIRYVDEVIASYTYVNYDKLVKDPFAKELASNHYDVIILDEAHLGIMRWSAKRCKNFFKYFVLNQPDQVIWCLTATPGNKAALDYHPLFCLCEPAMHGKEKEFGAKYCNQKFNPWTRSFDYTGFKNTDELKTIFKRISRRRTKQAVLPQLPKKLFQNIPVDINPKVLAQTLEINDAIIVDCIQKGKPIPAHIASLIAAIGTAKVKSAVDWIIDSGFSVQTPIVVFAWTKAVVHAVSEALNEAGMPACAFTGETAQSVRQTYIQDFQAGKYAAIILNMAAGGVGITLTKSSHVLFVELPWSPAHYVQCMDRVHRIGQKDTCNIYNLIANKTVDSAILNTLKEKMRGLQSSMQESYAEGV